MENPLWNLILRAASLVSVFLLGIGTMLVLANFLGISQTAEASMATVAFACVFSIFSLVAVNLSHSRLKRERSTAVDLAHQLSKGETFDNRADTELLEALYGVGVYLTEKAKVADRIAAGELPEGITPNSDADVLGRSFEVMTSRLRSMILTRESRDRLQHSVLKLLGEVSNVASGDLTVHADPEPEITGAIAEAFNSMTGNLRSLIRQVKDVSAKVGSSAHTINETTDQLAHGSVAQASQIARTTAAITKMAAQIREVSQNAELSAEVAAESLNNARLGTEAARENINAMSCVRRQVQETAKRIKRLGERAQEISQIVGQIEDLSDRTSLLALNASLQASAGGSDSGFSVVAQEVERLAERCNRLTQQISALAQTINAETGEVVVSMEETIHEVIVGSSLADKAGRSLVEIENVSVRLAELLRSISESAKYQAKSSEDISNAMSGISEVTQIMESGSRRAADSVKTLVELTAELRESVSPFKLPAESARIRSSAAENVIFLN
jgi:twitching motility protein PilJ